MGIYKIEFYAPESSVERVLAAMFAAGAGRIGEYDRCCWTTRGEGRFRPLPGSSPTIGALGVDERVAELKVEMVCAPECLAAALAALRESHPYETPAYQYFKVNE